MQVTTTARAKAAGIHPQLDHCDAQVEPELDTSGGRESDLKTIGLSTNCVSELRRRLIKTADEVQLEISSEALSKMHTAIRSFTTR